MEVIPNYPTASIGSVMPPPNSSRNPDEDLRRFLEKENSGRLLKHKTALEAPPSERCVTRRQVSFAIRDEEESINILVLGREKSGKSTFISAATQCPDFRYFVETKYQVTTTVSADNTLSQNIATFDDFKVTFTKIAFEALSTQTVVDSLRDCTYWAVVWTVDLTKLATKGALKEEMTIMRKVLEEPLEYCGIRGVLVCEMKKRSLFDLAETGELDTLDTCNELLSDFHCKVDEWKEHIARKIHVACPFPNNPPNIDSEEFKKNVKRALRNFFIEEGIDLIPWGSHLNIGKATVFPTKIGLLFGGMTEAITKSVTECAVSFPPRSETSTNQSEEEEKDKEGETSENKVADAPTSVKMLLALQPKKQYFLSKFRSWHPLYKVELSKEKLNNFSFNLFKANDTQWNECLPVFEETIHLLYRESKLDHLIIFIPIDQSEADSVNTYKRAIERIFTIFPSEVSLCLLFTGKAAEGLDTNKAGVEYKIHHHRQNLKNTIHAHKGQVEINVVNSAILWTVQKHLRKICGIDPQSNEELSPFKNCDSLFNYEDDYMLDVVSHDM